MKLLHGYILCSPPINKEKNDPDPLIKDQKALEEAIREASYLDWDNPDWSAGGHVHNWHNYASEALQLIWKDFSPEQKQIIAAALDECASNELWD